MLSSKKFAYITRGNGDRYEVINVVAQESFEGTGRLIAEVNDRDIARLVCMLPELAELLVLSCFDVATRETGDGGSYEFDQGLKADMQAVMDELVVVWRGAVEKGLLPAVIGL